MTDATSNVIPPRVVLAAVGLFVCSCMLGEIRVRIVDGWSASLGSVFGPLLLVALVYAVARALYKGSNWVRWLVVGCATLGVLFLPWLLHELPSSWERGVYLAQGAMQAIAAILLVLPTSSKWYRPNNSFNPTAEGCREIKRP